MQQAQRGFSPDYRNVGGRALILDQMLCHVASLKNTKPVVSRNSLYQLRQYHKSPTSKSQFDVETHLRNLEKSNRRIQALGNIENRRKNKQDYLLYPAFFFRRVDKEQLKKYINKSNPAEPGGDREKRKSNTSSDHKTIFQAQKQITKNHNSKGALQQILNPKKIEIKKQMHKDLSLKQIKQKQDHEIDWQRISKKIPKYSVESEEDFKQIILDIIIENRIISDDDYAFLVCLISCVNMHMDQQKILDIFQEIIRKIQNSINFIQNNVAFATT